MPKPCKRMRTSGFTMVEVASVLMIMGLMLGGILKGQEFVNAAKTRSLAQDFLAVQTALHGYQDKYRAIPGDNAAALSVNAHANVATTPVGKLGNGRIDGAWNSSDDSDESRLFWQHVRLAGFIGGAVALSDADYAPKTVFGTAMGISSDMQITAPTAMVGTYNICANEISGRFAKQLDMQMDDGNTLTGAVRVSNPLAPDTALPASMVDDGGKYLVCFAF
jgi:type II secretory pathway pseudopilin PulG